MSKRTIYITASDMDKLRKLINDEKHRLGYGLDRLGYGNGRGEHLQGLESELNRSKTIAADKVPPDVITMHSTAHLLDLDTDEELVCTLVFPQEAHVQQNNISVLAPIGTAMLGYREGSVFEWPVPDGMRRLQVKRVLYQPEAAGVDA